MGVADTGTYVQNRLEEELQQSREDNNQLITSHCETQVSSREAVLCYHYCDATIVCLVS